MAVPSAFRKAAKTALLWLAESLREMPSIVFPVNVLRMLAASVAPPTASWPVLLNAPVTARPVEENLPTKAKFDRISTGPFSSLTTERVLPAVVAVPYPTYPISLPALFTN